MTAILGISAFYHDSAAALVVDGRIVAAAQEERFTRKKHDSNYPENAVRFCLAEAGLQDRDLDYVAFYDKPLLKFDRLLETYLAFAPRGFLSFRRAMPPWLLEKLHLPRELRRQLPGFRKRFLFPEHHESHAASAFFPSPFEEAAVLTLDGVGEWATTSWGIGQGNKVALSHEIRFPHSLGLLYSAFTYFCGFKVNSGEYKLMGLAPYGEPRFAETILRELIDLKEDGSFRLNMSYFDFAHGSRMTSKKFHRLFGGEPREPEAPIAQREMDLAASIQEVTSEAILRIARHVHRQTGMRRLCMAGGVALNCVANGRILREGPFDEIWVQPAADDAGGALGAALLVWHRMLGKPRVANPQDSMSGAFLGPRFEDTEILRFLESKKARYEHCASDEELCERVAQLLASEKVVGWFQGRMEFGPRALGGRSILGDPRSPRMQSVMNLKIKFRESFRPFAPSVLQENVSEYFQMKPGQSSAYMLLVAPVSAKMKAQAVTDVAMRTGLDQLKSIRSGIPAVTHVDDSARVQTVDAKRHGLYHKLLETFRVKHGCGVVINTSFNVRGEPLVCAPGEAYRCFLATNMDALVLGHYVLRKHEQAGMEESEQRSYVNSFAKD